MFPFNSEALRRLFLVGFCLLSAAALIAGATSARGWKDRPGGSQLLEEKVYSPSIDGVLRFAVWLPADYEQALQRRYPVIYALHGLPGDERSYRSLAFLAPTLAQLHAEAIVVFPQGARTIDPDDEYQNLGPGHNWETALVDELPAAVNARFRTLTGREAQAIIGVSAGGYGAMILGLHHLDRYGAVESWSGYFHATSPDGSQPMQFSQPGRAGYADAHQLVAGLPRLLQRKSALIGFFTGSDDPYPGFTDENRRFDRELSSAGVPHRFAVYAGGHSQALWSAHAASWLAQLLRHLEPAQTQP